jgi:hypothetical protein
MIMHMVRATSRAVLTGSLAGLMACAQGPKPEPAESAPDLDYREADVTLMGGDLVRVQVALKGATEQEQIDSYARCIVVGYAMKNNAGFARHVRTVTDKEGGVWHADAVYSVTAALPEGLVTIDAEMIADDCESQGIPTGPKA